MVTVHLNNRQYEFNSYREARSFQNQHGGHITTPQNQSYEELQPREYQQPRRSTPPQTTRVSIIPNLIGTYKPSQRKYNLYKPATTTRKQSEQYYE